jgi:hypothetical protein
MFQLRNLQFGDVINSYKRHLPFYDIPAHLIRWHQRRKWDGANYKSTHSVLYLEGGVFFEVTAPRARFGNINEFTNESHYTVCRYRDANISTIPEREKDYFRETCWEYDSTKYDYFQLVDIGIKGILDWCPEYLPIFDLGRRRKVCSVMVVIAYLNWWEAVKGERNLRRPLGEQHAEVAAPADFENHPTFKNLGELII